LHAFILIYLTEEEEAIDSDRFDEDEFALSGPIIRVGGLCTSLGQGRLRAGCGPAAGRSEWARTSSRNQLSAPSRPTLGGLGLATDPLGPPGR
jgi:hypothetical protein